MKNRIAFVVLYFGKFPNFFPIFVDSVRHKKMDIHIFTDCKTTIDLPTNIIIHETSFSNMVDLFRSKIDEHINIPNAYKFCDLKPMYGHVLSEYLTEYEFWGSIDLDLTVGNFDQFLSDDTLNSIDVYSAINGYIAGSFFIVRNNQYLNNLFRKSKDLDYIIRNPDYCWFDECGGHFYEELKSGKTFDDIKPHTESFSELLYREPKESVRILMRDDLVEPSVGTVSVSERGVFFQGKEYLLVHYVMYKAHYTFFTDKYVTIPFYINQFGFFKNKPTGFHFLFSKNLRTAVVKRLNIFKKQLLKK